MKTQSIVLVLAGILVGCGAGATVAATWAGPTAGQWQCYQQGDLPDISDAAASGNAPNITASMNKIAPQAPVGATLVLPVGGHAASNVVCAKN